MKRVLYFTTCLAALILSASCSKSFDGEKIVEGDDVPLSIVPDTATYVDNGCTTAEDQDNSGEDE